MTSGSPTPAAGQRPPAPGSPHQRLRRATTECLVLETLAAEEGSLSRAELSRRSGISPPAISEAVRRLETADVVAAVGRRSGVPGAVATLYELAPGAGVVVAVELNSTVIRTAVADLVGRVVEEVSYDPPADVRATAERLDVVLSDVGRRFRDAGRPVRAVAVSVANPVDPETRRVVELGESAFPAGVVAAADVAGVEGEKVVLDNDVNFAAMAERDHGAAVGRSTFAYLYVGERHSIGLGLVVHGQVVRGAGGLAGEIGYLPVGPGDGRFRLGRAVAGLGLRAGVPRGDEQRDRAGRTLGEAATAVCAVVDPELIVLGGAVGMDPELRAAVEAAVAELAPRAVPVVASALGEAAPLWGALIEARERAWEELRSARG